MAAAAVDSARMVRNGAASAALSALQDDTVIATTTRADGAYDLLGLWPGDYVVSAAQERYVADEI